MKKIFLRDVNGQRQDVELVRYFQYQGASYLIYTFHEIDDRNFMTLYIVKVVNEFESPTAQYLSDEQEWQRMREAIKKMLEEIMNHEIKSFEDIDVEPIYEMQVKDARSFKLLASLVETLGRDFTSDMVEKAQIAEESKTEIEQSATKINEITNISTTKNKISTIEQLKSKYKSEEKKAQPFKGLDEMDLLVILPITQNKEKELPPIESIEHTPNIMEESLQEEFEHTMVDSALYRRLQEENEMLKKQLLQYQVKYQTLKTLLKTE